MAMTMVSARVPEEQRARAQEVLDREGMTMSDLVRVVIEYVSESGEVPDMQERLEEVKREQRMKVLREVLDYFETENPLRGIGDRDARELINEARDERFGLS